MRLFLRSVPRHRLGSLLLMLAVALGMAIALLGFSPSPAPAKSPPPQEIRGVWLTNIDSDVLFSKEKLRQGLQRLRRMNFNTAYPTVLNGGYTLYPSNIQGAVSGIALDPEPGLRGRDMLAEAVTEGRRQGLQIIPWLEFGFMLPDPSAIAQRHPDWLSQRRDGSEVWLEGGRIPRRWLNPFHPQVQAYLTALVAEIVSRYDIDGIQFDDHFGLPVDFGYDAYTTNLYARDHGGKQPPANAADPAWVKWRADKISAVMAQVFHSVKAMDPDCIVSLSPNPWEFAYGTYLQDWRAWERAGYVEQLLVQVYRDDMARFESELRHPTVRQANGHISTGIGILAGLKNRDVPMAQIEAQVRKVRSEGIGGFSMFFYQTLGNRDAAFAKLLGDRP
ncbi:MAG: family 10 glycosylhydrolase [Synechococcales cyanobacterium RM1_1_8]|nr:family 10 glycosylhydrolase [Synechococcales cyanobacterium RM1_1_8]